MMKGALKNRGDVMRFYDFMLDFLGDRTPLGKLARFIKSDVNYPKELIHPDEILTYFHSLATVDNKLLESVKRAIQLYVSYKS